MKATFLPGNSDHTRVMWEVHEGDKWWTVCFLTSDGNYNITGSTGREVSKDGRLGKRLIAATQQ